MRKLSSAALLGVAMLAAAGASETGARPYQIQAFTTRQGLPRNSVSCLVPGANGMLWICTSEGLVRFDGYHFRLFGREQGLPSKLVLGMRPSRRGGFWLLTERGLCHFVPESPIGTPCRLLQTVPPEEPDELESVVELPRGEVWVIARHTLYQVSADGRKLVRHDVRLPWGTEVGALTEGRAGAILLGAAGGVAEWRPGGEARAILQLDSSIGVFGFFRVSADEIWMATSQGVFLLNESGQARRCGPPVGLSQVLRRRDGSVWAAGAGLFRVMPGPGCSAEPVNYAPSDSALNIIYSISEDEQGDLWAATSGSGIFRLQEGSVQAYREGLGTARIGAIFEDLAGRICVMAADPVPLRVLQDGRFAPVPVRFPAPRPQMGWGWNQFGLQAHDGEWWYPTSSGLYRFARVGSPQELVSAAPKSVYGLREMGDTDVFRTFEDSHGDIWIALSGFHPGLCRWNRKTDTFQIFTAADGWPAGNTVTVIREAPSGVYWLATRTHPLRYRSGRFEVFSFPGLQEGDTVRDMLLDRAGRLWAATQRSGLYRCDRPDEASPVFHRYTVTEGLSADSVRSLVEDRAGYIYAGTVSGVDRIDPRAPIGSRHIRHFTPADGMPDSEHNVAYRDRHGHLWFGTLNGLADFDPERVPRLAPMDAYITRVRVRGEDVPVPWQGTLHAKLSLQASRNQVEIEFVGVDLASSASLRYQYSLAGMDERWSEPDDRLSVNYASLPPGRLQFRVRAVNADGQTSAQPAVLELDVAAPLWRRPWFVAASAVLLFGAGAALYNYRLRQLLMMERMRSRIADDLHDDMGSSLTQISILSEVAASGSSGRQALADIASLARESIEQMNDIVWAVNPRHDRFEAMLQRMRRFAGDTLGAANVDLKFEAEGLHPSFTLPLEMRRPLYLVFKEAVHNAVKHSGAQCVRVRLALDDNVLTLAVEDDGRGFDPETAGRGEGLRTMAERMKRLGGAVSWDTAPAQGTRFTATLPARLRKGRL